MSELDPGPPRASFDTPLDIGLLGPIAGERGEAAHAAVPLEPGGHPVALGPAPPRPVPPSDAAISRHRRYTRPTPRAPTPDGLVPIRLRYLDSKGHQQ